LISVWLEGGGGVLVDRFSGCGESVRADLNWEEVVGRTLTAAVAALSSGGSSGRAAPGGGSRGEA
jgi:hypothetical protein